MKYVYITIIASILGLSSCNYFDNYKYVVDSDVASSSITTKSGYPILSAGAIEAIVYESINKNPESLYDFVTVQEKLVSLDTTKIIDAQTLKKEIINYIIDEKCVYRSFVSNSLETIFDMYENTYNEDSFNLSSYNNIIDAFIVGISDAIELYESQHSSR